MRQICPIDGSFEWWSGVTGFDKLSAETDKMTGRVVPWMKSLKFISRQALIYYINHCFTLLSEVLILSAFL